MTEEPDETLTPTPAVRVGRLTSLRAVRRELARLYSDLRNDKVPAKIAGTGAFILGAIIKALEVEMLEDRVNALEDRLPVAASDRRPRLNG